MENVGGYRLVRKLGEGNRAEVWLGHAGAGDTSDGGVMAVKLFRSSVEARSIDVEIEALARASSPHLVELKDIATANDGRACLILGRLPGGSLAHLFAGRERFSAGELVTALAPIVGALSELHRVGVSHGGIAASAVLFDARRAPVLGCFGSARLIGEFPLAESGSSLNTAQQAADSRIQDDLAACDALVRSFAARVDDPTACATLIEWLHSAPAGDKHLSQLADRLYGVAEAVPVRSADPSRVPVSLVGRTLAAAPDHHFAVSDRAETQPQNVHYSSIAAWIEHNPVGILADRAKAAVRVVRRPVWIAAALGAAALVVAVAVVPSVGRARPSEGVSSQPALQNPIRSAAPQRTEAAISAAGTDDPLAAAGELVAARARCIVERSVGCLDTVEQAGSAALESDRYFLRQLQAGSTITDRKLDASTVALVQRLGDSAIVGLGAQIVPGIYPASVLIVKIDGRWKIRDLTIGATP